MLIIIFVFFIRNQPHAGELSITCQAGFFAFILLVLSWTWAIWKEDHYKFYTLYFQIENQTLIFNKWLKKRAACCSTRHQQLSQPIAGHTYLNFWPGHVLHTKESINPDFAKRRVAECAPCLRSYKLLPTSILKLKGQRRRVDMHFWTTI